MEASAAAPPWAILTNHGRVLVCVATIPDARARDIASAVGITERTTWAILRDLEDANYIARNRAGRRNRYHLLPTTPLHGPVERGATIADFLTAFTAMAGCATDTGSPRSHLVV